MSLLTVWKRGGLLALSIRQCVDEKFCGEQEKNSNSKRTFFEIEKSMEFWGIPTADRVVLREAYCISYVTIRNLAVGRRGLPRCTINSLSGCGIGD